MFFYDKNFSKMSFSVNYFAHSDSILSNSFVKKKKKSIECKDAGTDLSGFGPVANLDPPSGLAHKRWSGKSTELGSSGVRGNGVLGTNK